MIYDKLNDSNWNSWADPLASNIVFPSKVAMNRAIMLQITDKLFIEAAKAGELFLAKSS
jgi:purine nucleosidase